MDKKTTLYQYFKKWMVLYKKPILAPVTYVKYENTLRQIKEYFDEQKISSITPQSYQKILNEYATTHAKLTTSCFHKQIRACILDAIDEEIIKKDPTRKAIITGKFSSKKKDGYLSYSDWKILVGYTSRSSEIIDKIILLSSLTGMRFSEVLGLTWDDFDEDNQQLIVNKTWDYKYHQGFANTKNISSQRKIDVDRTTISILKELRNSDTVDERIFSTKSDDKIYSMTINRHLTKICTLLDIPIISFHALRHTHASILLYQGVNILSVSKRLGHSNVTTTQEVYLHIIKEMENNEREKIVQIMIDGYR
ncbi:MAG: site-specific integrase [Streptococcaceae bacterium]|nr:site-specific integrase [Streptococcaceae bacterium]